MLPLVLLALVLASENVLAVQGCDDPLLSKSTLTSSSDLSDSYSATHAQLTSNSAWCPKDNFTDNEYLQATFASFKQITRIKIEGEASPGVNKTARRVTKYLLQISKDGKQFHDFQQISQSDVHLEVNAIAVRFIPLSYDVFPCMRVAVHGCEAPSPLTCKANNTCSQVCVQHKDHCSKGSCNCPTDWACHKYISCKCHSGYQLLDDKRSCRDIDECQQSNGGCDQLCHNTAGSFNCSCKPGFKLRRDKRTCKDINECNTKNGGCNQICENKRGSYLCKCWTGYKMTADNHTCVDVNECKVNNGGCSHRCINFAGGYKCACPIGLEVDKLTEKQCVDTNECLLGNGGCEMFCHNNNGSYTCSCRDGFELYDTYKCRDIDECVRNTHQCDPQSTDCHNYQGGFECRCKKGFKFLPNNKKKCERLTCAPLVQSPGTLVSPDSCLVKDAKRVGDKCTFSCKPGYKLPDPSQDTMTCMNTANWDKAIISCRPIRCKSLAPPANGYVFPPFCSSTGNLFGQSCYYRCNSGYTMKTGQVSKRDCKSDGTWSIATGVTCEKVYAKPWINCPHDVAMALGPNSNTADVTALLEKPKSNVKDVKMFPEKYRTSLVFPAGNTKLSYVATNGNGATAQCNTDIIIEDKTPPRVVFCPPNIYDVTTAFQKVITWQQPSFADNVKVTGVNSNKKPGQMFYLGDVTVTYSARDAAGNTAQCSFDVSLKKLECPAPKQPENGQLSGCMQFGTTKYCRILCNPGKQQFQFTYGATCQLPGAKWNEIPDCVDAVRVNIGATCQPGMIHQTSLTGYPTFIKYCVKCPKGYKYDSAAKDCVKCPAGYTSLTESSTQCTKCPMGKSTAVAGSKNCLDQCKPGTSSQDGFDIPLNPQGCTHCSMGYYSDTYGATKCTQCPDKLTTLAKGAKSKDLCGIAPTVTEFGPTDITVDEYDRVEFVCKGNGPPAPTLKVIKARPAPDNLAGPVKIESILSGGKQIGIRYIILRASLHDMGLYSCVAANAFGKNSKYLNLIVKSNIIGSGDGAGV